MNSVTNDCTNSNSVDSMKTDNSKRKYKLTALFLYKLHFLINFFILKIILVIGLLGCQTETGCNVILAFLLFVIFSVVLYLVNKYCLLYYHSIC